MSKKFYLRKDFVFVFIIIILSFAIRWYNISSLPYGLEGDELAWISTSLFSKYNIQGSNKGLWSMHDALALATPVTIKINQLSFLLFGTDIISARKMLAILSVFSITMFYLLCRRFFKAFPSFLITMIYSLSAIKLITSRIVMGPSYSDLFLYITIFVLLLISKKRNLGNYLLALLGGLFTTLSLFIYNLAYWLPVLGVVIIIYRFFKERVQIAKIILILLTFLLPIILTFPKWFTNIKEEQNRKQYALSHVVLDMKKRQINVKNLNANIDIVFDQLVKGLHYETSDMLVRHNGTIIPLSITILAIIGIFISLFKIKTFFPVISWFILSFLPILLFGLYLPRMWINTIGVFYLLAAIPVNYIWIWASKRKSIIKYSFFVILLFGSTLIIYLEVNTFFSETVKNSSFSIKYRDIFELAKKARAAPKETVFVADADTNRQLVFPAMTFYSLAFHDSDNERIKTMTEDELNILTIEKFKDVILTNINNYKYIIVENRYINELGLVLAKNKLNPIKINLGNNFAQISIEPSEDKKY